MRHQKQRLRVWPAGLLAAVLGLPAQAQAQEWQGAVAAANDKVQRGASLSRGRPVWMLDLSRTLNNAGLSASVGLAGPVLQGLGGEAESNLALSQAWQLDADWTLLLSGAHYGYLGAARARAYSYQEAALSLGWRGQVTAGFSASPNAPVFVQGAGLRKGAAYAVELALHQRLVDTLALDLGVGWRGLATRLGHGYRYGSAGLSWRQGPLHVFMTRTDTRAPNAQLPASAPERRRWVASVAWQF